MSDEDYADLLVELERVEREYNTPELAREHLKSLGMLDADGELPQRYRDAPCP